MYLYIFVLDLYHYGQSTYMYKYSGLMFLQKQCFVVVFIFAYVCHEAKKTNFVVLKKTLQLNTWGT